MNRPTFTHKGVTAADKYQTQRSYCTSIQAVGRSGHSNAQFSIHAATRFESLRVADEQSTNTSVQEAGNNDHAPGYIHSKHKRYEFESTSLANHKGIDIHETDTVDNSVNVCEKTQISYWYSV